MGCRIRPYETKCGMTDEVIEECRESLYQGILTKKSREKIFTDIITRIQHIPVKRISVKKPKVSIIGDLYVRDNDVFNQRLIRSLEDYGAEVVTSPFTLILRILALKHKSLLKGDGRFLSLIKFGLLIEHLEKIERRYYKIASEPFPDLPDDLLGYMKKFNLSLEHGGETAQNILKIYTLIRHYQDLSLFIHVNPIFCCPGLVSESILKNVEKDIGIPIISITYDGTSTRQNSILAPHIRYLQQREMIH
jgi:predicted nucleotide-binding protein (sugar kinase/HSP70/actin superfamily)